MPCEYRYTNYQQNASKLNPQNIKRIIHHESMGFSPGIRDCFNTKNSFNVIHQVNMLKYKKYIIFSAQKKQLKKFNIFHDKQSKTKYKDSTN